MDQVDKRDLWEDFSTDAWLTDPRLSACKPQTRGIWIDWLCVMRKLDRSGQVTGTIDYLARLARCSPGEARSAIADLRTHQVADVTSNAEVTGSNAKITVTNRRMRRQYNSRHANNLRQIRFRERHQCNGPPTDAFLNTPVTKDVTEDVNEQTTRVRPIRESVTGSATPHVVVSPENTSLSENGELASNVNVIFSYWRDVMGHPQAKLTTDRVGKIRARLREGFTVEQIEKAIDGCKMSPFHMGENDQGKVFDDIELICRNGGKLEKFIECTKQRNQGSKVLLGNMAAREQFLQRGRDDK